MKPLKFVYSGRLEVILVSQKKTVKNPVLSTEDNWQYFHNPYQE